MLTIVKDSEVRQGGKIQEEAVAYAKLIGKSTAVQLTQNFEPDDFPVSVYMAGSPGAGKTESAKRLIEERGGGVLHIDPDAYRAYFPNYDGSNSYLFNRAVTVLAEKIHDRALERSLNYIFDSTLCDTQKAELNITRCLKRSRKVIILYVYQDPKQAWEFVTEREQKEGRHIAKNVFIEKFFSARASIESLKARFGSDIQIDVLLKNIRDGKQDYHSNISNIDSFIGQTYTESDLHNIL